MCASTFKVIVGMQVFAAVHEPSHTAIVLDSLPGSPSAARIACAIVASLHHRRPAPSSGGQHVRSLPVPVLRHVLVVACSACHQRALIALLYESSE